MGAWNSRSAANPVDIIEAALDLAVRPERRESSDAMGGTKACPSLPTVYFVQVPPCVKGDRAMDQVVASTPRIDNLFCALELSKNMWLLGIQFPDREQPSVYPIKAATAKA